MSDRRAHKIAVAILKLSYNTPGETPLTGGICGSGFFISSRIALTAHHVLNQSNITVPNDGFNHCRYWILSDTGTAIPVRKNMLVEYEDIDVTVIRFQRAVSVAAIYTWTRTQPVVGEEVYNLGFLSNAMPPMQASWVNNELLIAKCNLNSFALRQDGKIKRIVTVDMPNANDVRLDNVMCIEPSFGGREGMSGGPLISLPSEGLVGLMSFGLPQDTPIKQQLFAIHKDEIRRRIA